MRASASAVFESSPGRLTDAMRIEDLVNADRARLDLFRDPLSLFQIACPDTGGQSKFGIVGEGNRLFFGFERRYGKRRAKGFFLHRPHVITDIRNHSRLIEKLPRLPSLSAGENCCALSEKI